MKVIGFIEDREVVKKLFLPALDTPPARLPLRGTSGQARAMAGRHKTPCHSITQQPHTLWTLLP
jgi:hypothetical protein